MSFPSLYEVYLFFVTRGPRLANIRDATALVVRQATLFHLACDL